MLATSKFSLLIRKIFSYFIPRLIIAKKKPIPLSARTSSIESTDAIVKAVSWWQYDEYTRVKRYYHLRWLGRNWFHIPYYQSIENSYLKPADDLVNAIDSLILARYIHPLHPESSIFEPGCNVGKNLLALQNKFNCHVTGFDLSTQAINLAKNKIWRGRQKFNFLSGNILTTDYLKNLPDNHFDLTLTRWFLVHLPFSPAKHSLLTELKRISKTLLLFEPVFNPDETGSVELYADGRYCLSKDDWAASYGLTEYPSGRDFFSVNTAVFYHVK